MDNTDPIKSGRKLAVRPPHEVEIEARRLIDDLLDGRITPQQRHRLETLVTDHPAVAELYLEIVHLWYYLPLHMPRAATDLGDVGLEDQTSATQSMDEALIVPAIREPDVNEDRAEIFEPLAMLKEKRPSSKRWWFGSAAAVVVIGLGMTWVVRAIYLKSFNGETPAIDTPSNVVATVTATEGIGDQASAAIKPGAAFSAGQSQQINAGAVEVTFTSGAVATIKAPARFHIVDQNTLALDDGAMAAHVPAAAVGFRVISPGLSVVDRGTNFGVMARSVDAVSEIHVFNGKVDVTGTDGNGHPVSPAIPAVTGNAFRHDSAMSNGPISIPFAPDQFSRDIAMIRVQIPMHDTGSRVADNSDDPDWQIVSFPDTPNWRPRSAKVIATPSSLYTRFIPSGKWIGVNNRCDGQPVGQFIFRTTVDLTDFDPKTVSIQANAAADDYVSDIVVNGTSCALSTASERAQDGAHPMRIALPASAWHAGMNQIDVVVTNNPTPASPNYMLLHVNWIASGSPVIHK